MYCKYFQLQRLPFNNTPDPSFYYSTPDHEEALATLQYATQERKGFVLVTGEVGAGKTLIGRMFVRQVEDNVSTAVITHTHLNGRELLATICRELSVEITEDMSKLQIIENLQNYLLQEYARDRRVVVLLDEAQNLPEESFEELRMLGNLEADDAKLLQVGILGQPELRERFRQADLRQLEQRLYRQFHLSGMDRQQTYEYIRHRLEVAGCKNEELFTAEAIVELFNASGGIPRIINQICDNALLTAYGQESRVIDGQVISLVLSGDTDTYSVGAEEETRDSDEPEDDPEVERQKDRATDREIEKIYGSRPTITQSTPVKTACPQKQSEQVEELFQRRVGEREVAILDMEDSARISSDTLQAITCNREELQKVVDEAVVHRLAADNRIESLRSATVEGETIRQLQTGQEQLSDRLVSHEEEIKILEKSLSAERDSLRKALAELKIHSVSREDVEKVRSDHAEALADMLCRLEQQATAVEGIHRNLSEQREEMGLIKAGQIDEIFNRLSIQSQQLEQMRTGLQEQREMLQKEAETFSQRFARQSEVKEIRDQQAEQSEEFRAKLVKHSRSIQGQLKELDERSLPRAEAEEVQHRQEGRINEICQQMEDYRQAVLNQIGRLSERSASQEDVEQFQTEQREQIEALYQKTEQYQTGLLERLDKMVEQEEQEEFRQEQQVQLEAIREQLENHRQAMLEQIEVLSGQAVKQDDLEVLRERQQAQMEILQEQIEQHRRTVLKHMASIKESVVDREELEELRQENQVQAEQIYHQFDIHRQAVDGLIENLTEHCRSTQDHVQNLMSTKVSQEQLEENRRRQQDDVTHVLEQIGQHRDEIRGQLERLHQRWNQSQQQIESLSDSVVDKDMIDQLREFQERDTASLMETLSRQRSELEVLVNDVHRQCNNTLWRVNQLPDNIATADQLNEIQQEHAQHIREVYEGIATGKAGLEKAIDTVEQRCEKTDQALQELASQSASSEEVENLREAHNQSMQSLLDRIEHESSERETNLEDLRRRWDHLQENMDKLVETATPKSTFKAVNRSLANSVQALGQHVGDISHKHQDGLRNLVEKLQQSDRKLQELASREPVMVNVNPEGGRELAELLESVRHERAQLNEDLNRAEQITGELNQNSDKVNHLLEQWNQRVETVQSQSDHLRDSAQKAGNVLQAMQKCNQVIDGKLKSPQWREELKQGEQLAARLEQATREARSVGHQLHEALQDFGECQKEAESWNNRQQQAVKISGQLAKLITAAETSSLKLEKSVASRNRLIETIAQKTAGLAEVIQSAQREDALNALENHSSKSIQGNGQKKVHKIEWPVCSAAGQVKS